MNKHATSQGRPLKITDPLSHSTKYTYDGDGNVETVTDGNSRMGGGERRRCSLRSLPRRWVFDDYKHNAADELETGPSLT